MNKTCTCNEKTATQQSLQIFNIEELSIFLKRSESALRNLCLRRKIPYRKAGGRIVFFRSEVEEWLRSSPGISLEQLHGEKGDNSHL